MPARKSIKYSENPFMTQVYHDSKPVTRKMTAPTNDLMVVSREDLITADASVGLIFQHQVESNEFIKLYAKGVTAMWGLSSPGKKVFSLLFEQYAGKQGMNQDTVTLFYPSLSKEIQESISYRVFTRGINDLIKHGFIAESIVPAQFYINPSFFFNGDRMAIIHMYQKKKHTKAERLEEHGQIPLISEE